MVGAPRRAPSRSGRAPGQCQLLSIPRMRSDSHSRVPTADHPVAVYHTTRWGKVTLRSSLACNGHRLHGQQPPPRPSWRGGTRVCSNTVDGGPVHDCCCDAGGRADDGWADAADDAGASSVAHRLRDDHPCGPIHIRSDHRRRSAVVRGVARRCRVGRALAGSNTEDRRKDPEGGPPGGLGGKGDQRHGGRVRWPRRAPGVEAVGPRYRMVVRDLGSERHLVLAVHGGVRPTRALDSCVRPTIADCVRRLGPIGPGVFRRIRSRHQSDIDSLWDSAGAGGVVCGWIPPFHLRSDHGARSVVLVPGASASR